MSFRFITCVFLLLFFGLSFQSDFVGQVHAQQKYTVSGNLRDASSGETLAGATVKIEAPFAAGVTSNSYGFYSLTLPEGTYTLIISHIGYQTSVHPVTLNGDIRLDVSLPPGELLSELEITAVNRKEQLESPQMGVNKLAITEVNKVPVLLGERDVLKTIQLLPGVMAGGEGSSGFFVRGGSADQNLILLDEAMVYNASHLFGFFSTFNSDAIKDVALYKGGMPAQYGGRLASVVDITMLDGNKKRYGAEGGIGLIASRFKAEGPLVKDRGSFMVSARRTYADMFLKLSRDTAVNGSRLYFYDLNLKANYQLNDKNIVYVSGYFGKDILGYSRLFGFDWGNATATARWNHIYNSRLFSNTSLIFSDFNYNVHIASDNNEFSISSRIRNYNLKHDFQYFSGNRSTLRFGVDLLRQRISPAGIEATQQADINSLRIEDRTGAELAGYLSHEWKATERLNVVYGLRVNTFLLLGPGTFYEYDADGDVESSSTYTAGKVARHYLNLEPRFSASYQIDPLSSVKASYNRNVQNLHQLSNSTAALPTDAWVMSSNNIRPQIADQGAVGYYRNFRDDRYEFSTEVYYKNMQRQIDYKNGADLQANEHVEADLLFGDGRAYGMEWYLKKRDGRLNGWISYTLSRTERRFDDINNGTWFPARQDRTHDLSLVGIYQLAPRWSLSGSFIYSTGNAVTFPGGKYVVGGMTTWYYTERNGYRMPDYHRLDLGATLSAKPGSRFQSSWTFSVYNAYNRKNAYIIDFRESATQPNTTEAYRLALFGIIPAVTWNFKF